MKQDKKLHYERSVYAGIHTLSGTTSKEVTQIDESIAQAVKCSIRKVRNKDAKESYLQLNPNKLSCKGRKLIDNYTDFVEALECVLAGCGLSLEDLKITRADMAYNSNNAQDYLLYQKLHRLLICCIADAYSFQNCYQTYDLWTYQSLNVAIKNDDYEAENYDKAKESDNKDVVKNRLEFRSKRIKDSDLMNEFLVTWADKLDEAITHFKSVQDRYNDNLVMLWNEDLQKPKEQRKYYNLTAFLMQYADCIFCSKQMIDLLTRLGIENPQNKAKNFKRNHKIEYFSQSDLRFIVDVIRSKSLDYFVG